MKNNLPLIGIILVMLLFLSGISYAGTLERMSIDSYGNQGNSYSAYASVSADGRYVAFMSYANNLVPGDTNNSYDIFVRDRVTGVTERVSVDSNGNEANGGSYYPSISADGRYVAFSSDADNLVAGDNNYYCDAFVHDRVTGVTERVSVDSNGNEAYGDSLTPAISADGRYVVFVSDADNLVAGDTNYYADIFLHDRATGVTERVSVDSNGNEAYGDSLTPSISADGRYVAFSSNADNLVAGDTNGAWDIFVRDRGTGTTERVSVDSSGNEAKNGASYWPAISADGRYVAFDSLADNLVAGDTNAAWDIFVRDRGTGTTERVSIDSSGNQANGPSYYPHISADGLHVSFESMASNLVTGDNNSKRDVFAYHRATKKTERISVGSSGSEANSDSNNFFSSMSADGKYVAFYSYASNLVAGDTNGTMDVFIGYLGPTTPQTPADLIAYIQDLVNKGQLEPGVANSLIYKIKLVMRTTNSNAAKGALWAFTREVRALTGKKISPDIAAILIEAANTIKANLPAGVRRR